MIDLQRFLNGLRKVAAGLRPFSESVWPGVRNDLFVAHESIYWFFAKQVRDLDVLDAGCGTGYGSRILAEAWARSVSGVDLDGKNVRYARRHFGSDRVRFEIADIEQLEFPDGSFGAAIASNSAEHLHDPRKFFDGLARIVSGPILLAVPPIYTASDAKTHSAIHYHRSNLAVSEWMRLLDERFTWTFYLHRPKEGVAPDFSSAEQTRLTADDFEFEAVDRETALRVPSITAVFLINGKTPLRA